MQAASQNAPDAAETPKKGKGYTHKPSEGNILWKLYCELGRTRLAEFYALLKRGSINFNTFISHTAIGKHLSSRKEGTYCPMCSSKYCTSCMRFHEPGNNLLNEGIEGGFF